MAHELTIRKNKQAEMAFVGEKPWHGLGNELKPGASIETWVKAAGMDWNVERSPVVYKVGEDLRSFGLKNVLYRSDTNEALGVVSNQYKIMQPKAVLEFFRDLCENNDFKLETAGTLFGGRIYWALANIGEQSDVLKGDRILGRLLLSTSADGTKSTVAKFLATRVVCNNTLTVGMREAGGSSARVSHRSEFDAATVYTDLGIGHDQFAAFMKNAKILTEIKVTDKDSELFLENLLNKHGGVDRGEKVAKSKPFLQTLELYKGKGKGADMAGVKGTAWGLVNAVTEYMDHHRRAALADNRLNNTWFGFGERLKSAAFDLAMNLAPKTKAGTNKVTKKTK
jgi:phage/plasmid-like protein (TIGR03299 family)